MTSEQLRRILCRAAVDVWTERPMQKPGVHKIAERHVYCDCDPEVWARRCAECGREVKPFKPTRNPLLDGDGLLDAETRDRKEPIR